MTHLRAVFSGKDVNNQSNLWVTDGTSAGTIELNVSAAYSGGMFNNLSADFTPLGTRVLFKGEDTNGHVNLWTTDGTSIGTNELTNANTAPLDITEFGSKAVFAGLDAGGHCNLWVTDGTLAGTSQVTVAGAYTGGGGLSPGHIAAFGAVVLFSGKDATGHINLWVTDGTSSGTSELTVAGANPGGLFGFADPFSIPDFTPLGGVALFEGVGTDGHVNLWVTNGTSAGTSELSAAGAYPGGLYPGQMAVLGSKVLIEGSDASNNPNLWVTDGTWVGTSELTVGGSSSAGLFVGIDAQFTVIGSKALFKGFNSSGHLNLWVTDGTSAGTSELIVAGANAGGLFSSDNVEFVALGGGVLFGGVDASGKIGLWRTDGTSAGTSELMVAEASPNGLDPGSFSALGGNVLFEGKDANGTVNLWVTDGTSAGTSELMIAGASAGGLNPFDIESHRHRIGITVPK